MEFRQHVHVMQTITRLEFRPLLGPLFEELKRINNLRPFYKLPLLLCVIEFFNLSFLEKLSRDQNYILSEPILIFIVSNRERILLFYCIRLAILLCNTYLVIGWVLY